MSIWEQHIAPTRDAAFIVAGGERFFAMPGDRTAASRAVATVDEAMRLRDAIDDIFGGCPARQIGCAAVAAMAVL